MPVYSSLRTFIDALKTRRTNITKTLDALLADPKQWRNSNEYTAIQNDYDLGDAKKRAFPDAIRIRLANTGLSNFPGLSTAELEHIEQWPKEQKEQVRVAVMHSIDHDKSIKFFWELHDGPEPQTVVNHLTGDRREVIFKSPRRALRVRGDDVFVEDVPSDPDHAA
jgi:hypothetical protein